MAASTINTECKRYGCMKNLLACFANCRYPMRCDQLRNELVDKTAQAENDINQYLTERGRKPILVQILKRGVKFDDPASRQSRKTIRMASPLTIEAKPRVKPNLNAKPTTKAPMPSAAPAKSLVKEKKRRAIKARKLASVAKDKPAKNQRAPRPAPRPAAPQARRQSKDHKTVALPMPAALASPRVASLRVPSAIKRKPGKARLRKRAKMPGSAKLEMSKTFKDENSSLLEKSKMIRNETPATPSQESSSTANRSEITTPSGKPAGTRKKSSAKSRNGKANGKGNGKVYIIVEGQTATIVDEKGLMAHLFSSSAKNVRYFEASEVEARVQIIAKR